MGPSESTPSALRGCGRLALGDDQARGNELNRVLIVPASYPPILGGVQTVAHRLACHLAGNQTDVTVLTRRYPRSLPRCGNVDGISVTRSSFLPPANQSLAGFRPDLALASLVTRPVDRKLTRRLLREKQPEVVNIHFPDWQVDLIPLIRSLTSSRLVISLHGDEVMRAIRGDRRQRNRLITALSEADYVTACSGWLLERACVLEASVAGKSTVIWNGIDGERFRSVDPTFRPRPYVLGFGRFVPKKGFDLLIESFADLGNSHGLDLVLVGSGPELDSLRILARDRGIGDRVVFPGRAFEDAMAGWIRGARLAVVPSREEPFGIAALEVAAAGVPLVATAVGGMPEFLNSLSSPDTMVRFSAPVVGSLRKAMQAALEMEPDANQVVKQIGKVRAEYDWSHRLSDFDRVFRVAGSSESIT